MWVYFKEQYLHCSFKQKLNLTIAWNIQRHSGKRHRVWKNTQLSAKAQREMSECIEWQIDMKNWANWLGQDAY